MIGAEVGLLIKPPSFIDKGKLLSYSEKVPGQSQSLQGNTVLLVIRSWQGLEVWLPIAMELPGSCFQKTTEYSHYYRERRCRQTARSCSPFNPYSLNLKEDDTEEDWKRNIPQNQQTQQS